METAPPSKHHGILPYKYNDSVLEGVIRRMERGNYQHSPSEILHYGQQRPGGGWSEMAGNGAEPEPRPVVRTLGETHRV